VQPLDPLYGTVSGAPQSILHHVVGWRARRRPWRTQNMVELVRKLTGRQPIIIDPASL
jgi:hypothetical protein